MVYKTYKKLVCHQDVERTPSLSVFAIRDFFRKTLDNGERTILNLIVKGTVYEVELHKRNTRNEYRFFLNRIRDEIGYNVDDILVFSQEKGNFVLNVIRKNQFSDPGSRYSAELNSMRGNLHFLS